MLVRAVVAAAFESNCYVVAAGRGQPCLIVDPGIGVLPALEEVLEADNLSPAAVLLTHGHIDHCFSVAPVGDRHGVTAYVHPDDREMVADPEKWISGWLLGLFGGRLPYTAPDDVAPLPDDGTITVAGLEIRVDHAPGHTGGSVLFRLTGIASGLDAPPVPERLRGGDELCLSGDVLFAGSIGRTDLPGGSTAAMRRTLRDKILPMDDATVVLPGHGPATTIGRERQTNPYLLNIDAW
ncbi:MAG: MBL fold metallo-hydrolase [Micromonosporaceae bacterium]|nr:MBL fold metallo-hydrolase [Micromonosporaceae bacterium]